MKRRIFIGLVVLITMLFANFASAQTVRSKSTGLLTADKTVITGKSILTGFLVVTDGTNNATIVIYDNTSAAGTELAKIVVLGASYFGGGTFEIPIRCTKGIYADITGTGASYIIYYNVEP